MKSGASAWWRDFLNRREPGARWMLLLLVAVLAVEAWLFFATRGVDPYWPRPLQYLPVIAAIMALLTCRWWSLPSSPAFPDPKWGIPPASRRWVWFMAAAITLLAMWPRSTRLNHSLTDREIALLSQAANEPGMIKDHLTADAAVEVLGQTAGENPDKSKPGERRDVNERLIRTLPWAAGILTTGLIVLLGAALGSPRAGLAGGMMLALHPEHVRWSSELGDYAHSLLFIAGAVLCLLNALHTNRWRWWVALAGTEACALFASSTPLLWLPAMNASALAVLALSKPLPAGFVSQALRLVAAAAIAGVVLLIPSAIFTALPFSEPISLTDQWYRVLAGVPAESAFQSEDAGYDIAGIVRDAAWRGPVLWLVLPACIAAGFGFMVWQDWRTRLLAGTALVVAVLSPESRWGVPLFLPLLAVWAGAGLLRVFPRQSRLLHAPLFIAVLYVAGTTPALQRMIQVPQQPLREVAAAARKRAGEAGTNATFGNDADYAGVYDPGVRRITTTAELEALIDAAYEKDLPLLVYRRNDTAADPKWSALNERLTRSSQFHLAGEFAAFDPGQGYELYRYQSRVRIIPVTVQPEKK